MVWKNLVLIISLLSSSICHSASEGKPAPEFSAKLFSDKKFSAKSSLGEVIVIHFWASWCEACQLEMPLFDDYFRNHKSDGLEIIAVSMDNAEDELKARAIAGKYSFDFTFAKDASFKSYGRIWQLPLTFVIDRKGILRKDGWVQKKAISSQDLESTISPLLKVKP